MRNASELVLHSDPSSRLNSEMPADSFCAMLPDEDGTCLSSLTPKIDEDWTAE